MAIIDAAALAAGAFILLPRPNTSPPCVLGVRVVDQRAKAAA
jgi:hypothetical protein